MSRNEIKIVTEPLTDLEIPDYYPDGPITIAENCYHCEGEGVLLRQCCDRKDLMKVDSPLNDKTFEMARGNSHEQGYRVWECQACGQLWGERYQWDPGTGSDDDWARLDNDNPVRHYF